MVTAAVAPEPAVRRNKRSRVGAVAGGVDAVDGRRLARVDGDRAIGAQLAAQRADELGAQSPAVEEEQRVAVERRPVGKRTRRRRPVSSLSSATTGVWMIKMPNACTRVCWPARGRGGR
jgi:hypothetical protein